MSSGSAAFTAAQPNAQLKSDFVVFPYQLERPVLLETLKNMTRQPWLDEAVERLEYQAPLAGCFLEQFRGCAIDSGIFSIAV